MEYDQHNNSFESPGYVAMFERFIETFITPLQVTGVGLEFGSGPGPVLKELLQQQGFEMVDYDYFYNRDESYKTKTYDFITSTEVFEHLTNPLEVLQELHTLLKAGGYLIVMTQLNTFDNDKFLTWWYRRDKTHISFFSLQTINHLTNTLGLELVTHNHKNVFVWRKPLKQ
jgi:SAM-dependent methyltransferase